MCVVSMVIDGWRKPESPNFIPNWPQVRPDTASDMLKVIELLEKIDKKLDAKDCSAAEPDKNDFKRKLQEIVDTLP